MIRQATPKDERILRDLLTSLNKEDYVLNLLTTWLNEGEIFVYETDRIVGMVRLSASPDGTAYMGAVRVHPDFRRQGIATRLTQHCITLSRKDTVRLAIMRNPASQVVAEKMGFIKVATFTFLFKKVERAPPVSLTPVTPREALPLLEKSPSFVENHSLLSSCFKFYTPSDENMKSLLLFTHGDNVAVLDFEIEEALTKAVQITYCDPDPVLVKAILHDASQRGLEEMWVIIPKDEMVIDCLKSFGFEQEEWGETINVFELRVI